MFKRILVPYDGSQPARKALDVALEMARLHGSAFALLSVEEGLPHFPGDIGEVKDEKEAQNGYFGQLQREARDAAKLRGLDFERADIVPGHAAQTIISHAAEIRCDLIVIGHHSGRPGIWASFLGNTAERVSRYAPCSVLIVR